MDIFRKIAQFRGYGIIEVLKIVLKSGKEDLGHFCFRLTISILTFCLVHRCVLYYNTQS